MRRRCRVFCWASTTCGRDDQVRAKQRTDTVRAPEAHGAKRMNDSADLLGHGRSPRELRCGLRGTSDRSFRERGRAAGRGQGKRARCTNEQQEPSPTTGPANLKGKIEKIEGWGSEGERERTRTGEATRAMVAERLKSAPRSSASASSAVSWRAAGCASAASPAIPTCAQQRRRRRRASGPTCTGGGSGGAGAGARALDGVEQRNAQLALVALQLRLLRLTRRRHRLQRPPDTLTLVIRSHHDHHTRFWGAQARDGCLCVAP